jgi:tRNA G37 N-methylase TrmD
VAAWREAQAYQRTKERRPDLLEEWYFNPQEFEDLQSVAILF